MSKIEIPVWEKVNITVEEAAALFSIGENAIREKIEEPGCKFVLMKGTHKLIKRKKFEEYLENLQVW